MFLSFIILQSYRYNISSWIISNQSDARKYFRWFNMPRWKSILFQLKIKHSSCKTRIFYDLHNTHKQQNSNRKTIPAREKMRMEIFMWCNDYLWGHISEFPRIDWNEMYSNYIFWIVKNKALSMKWKKFKTLLISHLHGADVLLYQHWEFLYASRRIEDFCMNWGFSENCKTPIFHVSINISFTIMT